MSKIMNLYLNYPKGVFKYNMFSNSRPSPWDSASCSSASVSTLTTDTDQLSSAAALVSRHDTMYRRISKDPYSDDEYMWDEMTARVDDLLQQELKESDSLERTVADAEEHCSTVSGSVHII